MWNIFNNESDFSQRSGPSLSLSSSHSSPHSPTQLLFSWGSRDPRNSIKTKLKICRGQGNEQNVANVVWCSCGHMENILNLFIHIPFLQMKSYWILVIDLTQKRGTRMLARSCSVRLVYCIAPQTRRNKVCNLSHLIYSVGSSECGLPFSAPIWPTWFELRFENYVKD